MADKADKDSNFPVEPSSADRDPPSLFERVGIWLAAEDLTYSENSEAGWYSMQVSLDCGSVRTVIDTDERDDGEAVLVFCIFPVKVPAEKRRGVAELCARINHRSMSSMLQIDLSDGEVRSRSALDLVGASINEATFSRLVGNALRCADRAYAAILSVAFGEVTPTIAFERIEAAAKYAAESETLQ